MSRHVFRIFVSSTFGDFQSEREALRDVWKRLEGFCASHGASFQVVDLRWGIGPDVVFNHDTIQICLDEVKRCQKLSPKPNFLMLIGDRYGWRPPAVTIPDEEFTLINDVVSDEETSFLEECYCRDANAIPPEWCLRPREGKYKSSEVWSPIEQRLVAILQRVARELDLPPKRYLYSATHQEIVQGLLNYDGAREHVFTFNRTIKGLPLFVAGKNIARRFSDYLDDGSLDQDAAKHRKLLLEQIASALPAEHIHAYSTKWSGDEDAPIATDHIEQLSTDVENALKQVILSQFRELKRNFEAYKLELEGQERFLKDTGAKLFGRKNEQGRITAHIAGVLTGKNRQPLIVTGAGGAGKSALMADSVTNARTYYPDAVIVFRFIGATARSWTPLTFIEDLINQIITAYGNQRPEMPETIQERSKLFRSQLRLATSNKPLILIIDGLDQLNASIPVAFRDLFPKELPENLSLMLSALDGTEQNKQLQALYPEAATIEIKPLRDNACEQLLIHLLSKDPLYPEKKRTITDEQKKILLSSHNGIPLAVTLIAPVARKLSSNDTVQEFPKNLKLLVKYIIDKIITRHGEALTTVALRYIKLARFGLSENELQEVLWRDPEVLAEFNKTKNPDQPLVNALPPVIWSRLYAELDPYINEHWMDGQLLYRYFHRIFGEVADEMEGETRKALHSRLADYFTGQELYSENQSNGRKLMELPWQLQQCERWKELKELICDIPFFQELYERDEYELLSYWLKLGSSYDAGTCYSQAFNLWEKDELPEQDKIAAVANELGIFLTKQCASYEAAEPFYRRALKVYVELFGHDHLYTASSLNNLADLMRIKGDFDNAALYFRQALGIYEKILSPTHPKTATVLNNLVGLMEAKGDYDSAENYCRRVLEIREKIFGPDHQDTAMSLNNLASILESKNDLNESELLYRRALVIYEKTHGPEHPATATLLSNLAGVMESTGDLDNSEQFCRRALSIREKVLSPTDPDTAGSLSNLAHIMESKGNFDSAEPLYRRALEIYEKSHGLEHPATAVSLNNLAGNLRSKGHYDDAISLYRRAFDIMEKMLPEHPDTATFLVNWASSMELMGDLDSAGKLFRQALSIRENIYGPEHPATLDLVDSIESLACILFSKDDYEKAESLFRRALEAREKGLGSEHLDTARSLNNLARVLELNKDFDSAEPLYRRAFEIRNKELGPDHSDTLKVKDRLINLICNNQLRSQHAIGKNPIPS